MANSLTPPEPSIIINESAAKEEVSVCVPPISNGRALVNVNSLTVKSLTVKSAAAVPTLSSQLSVVSFQMNDALSEVPLLTSRPPLVDGAPVTDEFTTIMLSSMLTVSESVVVTAPETVKSPWIVVLPPIDASPVTDKSAKVPVPPEIAFVPASISLPNVDVASEIVNLVAVALSSIPVDANVEIVPPSILSPDIWSSARVNVPADTSKVLPEPTVIS